MEKENNNKKNKRYYSRSSGGVYFLGLIGAAIYYISMAATLGEGVIGFLKALVWPVFLVLETLKYLGA